MRIAALILVSLVSFISGCGDRSVGSMAESSNTASASTQDPDAASPSRPGTGTGTGSGSGHGNGGGGGRMDAVPDRTSATLAQTEQTRTQSDRKIIRNADLSLEATSPEETQKTISAIVESKGGYVVETQLSSSDVFSSTRDVVSITVRVPAENFASAIDEIRKAAERVVVETVKGQDVTEEFIDIEADLVAKKALEQQFIEIMKRANTVKDALDVQRQLAEVRGEIEKIEGRRRFLENQSSLSTIKIKIQTPAAIASRSTGFGYRLTEAFGDGMDFALNFILGLVSLVIGLLPFVLLIGVPGFFMGRWIWRKRRSPMSAREIARDEIESE